MKYDQAKVICVDVDGTLHQHGQPNAKVIAWCKARKDEGYSLTLWSARGEEYARQAATKLKIIDLFDHIIAKPGYVLDDQGWNWIRYTTIVHNLHIELP